MQEPFIDFSTSRNRALDLAEEKFPTAAFMLMPDAEWYTQNVPGLIDFCKKHLNEDFAKTYSIRIYNPGIDFVTTRLIRCRTNSRFFGSVHEVLMPSGINVPRNVAFEYKPSKQGALQSEQRWKRDVTFMLKDLEKNPNDPRTNFYLAQTYECLGDTSNAYKYYLKRSTLAGWDEENYETFYRLGRLIKGLAKSDPVNFNWGMALNNYLIAFRMRPWRAEPLLEIAEHYMHDNPAFAFVFSKFAYTLPYPTKELLFVDKFAYDYKKYDVNSRCAWTVGDYKLGEAATEKALELNPSDTFLLSLLNFYKGKNQIADGK
jgi:tetratricopeptide (TPR) repeat protein